MWSIDHGICFHSDNKLPTVIWDFAGQAIPEDLLADLRVFRERLDSYDNLQTPFNTLLSPPEIAALRRRADRLLKNKCFPDPGPGRNFPWPPV